jgi:hypothetical protein
MVQNVLTEVTYMAYPHFRLLQRTPSAAAEPRPDFLLFYYLSWRRCYPRLPPGRNREFRMPAYRSRYALSKAEVPMRPQGWAWSLKLILASQAEPRIFVEVIHLATRRSYRIPPLAFASSKRRSRCDPICRSVAHPLLALVGQAASGARMHRQPVVGGDDGLRLVDLRDRRG